MVDIPAVATPVSEVRCPPLPQQAVDGAPSPYDEPARVAAFIARQVRPRLDAGVLDALATLRLGRGPAAVRIRIAPEVPEPARTAPPAEWSAEYQLLVVADALGHAYGYRREHGGAIVQQITARPGQAEVASSEGNAVPLAFHTENAFADSRPDFVLLLCREVGPRPVPTLVLDVGEVLARLAPAAIDQLARAVYTISSPPSFGTPAMTSTGVRVLEQGPGGTALRIDFPGLLSATDPASAGALEQLFAATAAAGTPVHLDAGDMLVIDNRRSAHGRPAYDAVPGGRQRWLSRCLVKVDPWSCRDALEREDVLLPELEVAR